MRIVLPELTKKSLNTVYQREVSDFDALLLIQYMDHARNMTNIRQFFHSLEEGG